MLTLSLFVYICYMPETITREPIMYQKGANRETAEEAMGTETIRVQRLHNEKGMAQKTFI